MTHTAKLFSKIGLPTKPDRAIDLSCRACGAGAWALGLDSRLGHSRFAPVFTPNLRFSVTDKTKLSLIGRLGVGDCGNVGIANDRLID